MFKDAKWIWIDKKEEPDEYAEFKSEFYSDTENAKLFIAAETDYIAYLNGKRVANGAFPNYKDRKYYDEIDLNGFLRAGKNLLVIEAHYEGVYTSRHIVDNAGIIFSVEDNGKTLVKSGTDTKGGLSGKYIQHVKRYITGQLGLSVNMQNGKETVYGKCRETALSRDFCARPVKKLVEKPAVCGKKIKETENSTLFDLCKETNGYVFLSVDCADDCDVKLCYGEHIKDGGVRRNIGGRNFSFDFHCVKGVNNFEQFFVRMAGRYIEIFAENAKVINVGIIPVEYPVTEKGGFLSGIDKSIYDTCVRTLKLCMTEHYEDCPWREQCLYVLDGRNQMLCGYYAFNETEFQRANLAYISRGKREDGLLELTFPCEGTPAIPFFSIMYPVAVYEYVMHTGDESILKEVFKTLQGIVERFVGFIDETGLIANPGSPYWNFYEWSEGSHHEEELCGRRGAKINHELIMNCAFIYMVKRYEKLCELIGIEYSFDDTLLKKAIVENLWDENSGVFRFGIGNDLKTELGNAFACLIGLGDERTVNALKGNSGLVGATLSTKGFVYDALLKSGNAEEFVLNDIRRKYGNMLDQGATSFWETEKGESDFDGAGSLCHGWSAMPVYYYNILKGAENGKNR